MDMYPVAVPLNSHASIVQVHMYVGALFGLLLLGQFKEPLDVHKWNSLVSCWLMFN